MTDFTVEQIREHFSKCHSVILDSGSLPMFTVYFNPSDYPGQYVIRLHAIDKTGPHTKGDFAIAGTLEKIRSIIPDGLVRLVRDPDDDPVIVEVWV